MKFTTSTILVAVAFIFIVCISLYGGCKEFTPYSFSNSTLQGHNYEGFGPMLEYTTYPAGSSIDSYNSKNIDSSTVTDITRIKGFDGLYGASTLDDSSIDIFSKAEGKTNCESHGLTNSRGFLCLDAKQLGLLTSRGGNATGK